MAAVSLKHIKKFYPSTEKKKKKKGEEAPAQRLKVTEEGVLAVDDFNLEIADREFIVLRLRQVHHPADDRGTGGDQRRRADHRR